MTFISDPTLNLITQSHDSIVALISHPFGTVVMESHQLTVCLLSVFVLIPFAAVGSHIQVSSFNDDVDLISWKLCTSMEPINLSFLAVVSGRNVYKLSPIGTKMVSNQESATCVLLQLNKSFMSVGTHKVALYTEQKTTGKIQLVDLYKTVKVLQALPRETVLQSEDLAASSKPLVGILYATWHAGLGASSMQQCAKEAQSHNSTCPTTEYVIRNSHSGSDSIRIRNLTAWWNVTPRKGFYCIYRKCPGEKGLAPDCPNITETLTAHASELLQAGIDFVALDGTNMYKWPDDSSDMIQLRPTEVLFEEWAKLREKGVNTPKIVVWNLAKNGSLLWQQYLDRLYNNPNKTYQELLLINKLNNKKVFMVPDKPGDGQPSPDVMSAIESNGGRNDIDVIKVWADKPPQMYYNGTWGFMTPCGDEHYTTTVQSMIECHQMLTYNSSMGSAIAVSPAYQMGSFASTPFGSPSKLGGLTFKLQFATALRRMPNNYFVSSFNEFITGPLRNAWGGPDKLPWAMSVGLEWDPDRYSGWVDTFGAYRSRDIEPTEDYGDLFYNIMSSCFRVSALNAASNRAGCNVEGEECCDIDKSRQYKPIWSLRTLNSAPENETDFLFTDNEGEKDRLTGPSGNYQDICAALGRNVDTFCYNGNLAQSIDAARGPFLMFSIPGENRVPLYRCAGAVHYFSTQQDCEGLGKMEYQLGWVSSLRNSETARSLRRCQSTAATSKHTYFFPIMDNACPDGTSEKLIGFVV